MSVSNSKKERDFWSKRYEEERTGWDIGYPSTPLKTYIDQLEHKDLSILIPGAGNAYEAEYLFKNGFTDITVVDIAPQPLKALKERIPDFPEDKLIEENFFEHHGKYDLIIEQTFFCSFPPTPETRELYAKQMHQLLNEKGKLVGLWFNHPLTGDMEKRPFGGTKREYLTYLTPYFNTVVFELANNSIPQRQGNELFGIFRRK